MPKTHKPYDEEFRRGAVDLVLHSGRSLKELSSELGVSANTLRAWRNKALVDGTGGASARGETLQSPTDAAAEIRRLHKEVAYLRRQREILKKAAAILAEDPQAGMR